MFLVLMFVYRDDVEQFVQKMKDHDATHDTFSYAQDFAELTKAATPTAASSTTTAQKRRPSRRASMMITQATDLMWLSSKLGKFQPQSWWTSSYLVAMRILQTSAMVFIASLIALIAVSVQTHTAPYRRASDNRAALVATWVIFIWCFVLLVRHTTVTSEWLRDQILM
jgi:hypothetical protein